MAFVAAPAPLKETFWLGNRINPEWERWFASVINPALEVIRDIESTVEIKNSPMSPLSSGIIEALSSMLEAFIFQMMTIGDSDLRKRVEDLETQQHAIPKQNGNLSQRIVDLESSIQYVPLPRFYPVVDYEANPTVTTLRDNLITLGLMGAAPDDRILAWEDEDIMWEDEGITHEDI